MNVTFSFLIRLKNRASKRGQIHIDRDTTKTKLLKLALVCVLCIALTVGLVLLVQFLT